MRTNLAIKSRFVNPDPGKLAIAHNALNGAIKLIPVYFIERASIKEDHVEVFFVDEDVLNSGIINEDDWKDAKVSLANLETYVRDTYSNASLFSDLTVYHFVEYNLHEVLKGYLEAGKELYNV